MWLFCIAIKSQRALLESKKEGSISLQNNFLVALFQVYAIGQHGLYFAFMAKYVMLDMSSQLLPFFFFF